MVDAGTQCCAPPEAKGMTTLYQGIRFWFRACAAGFYATTEVHGLNNVPPNGKPTIVCFNHGNGLADPLVLIRKTPRMVRFWAKDALWNMPVMKYFIRNSGAVPVYRAKDHGAQAKELNLEVFRTVISALRDGDCLGMAPEGVSRFLPYMEAPLKTGVARIALEAVAQSTAAGDPSYAVQIIPVGLTYTHREKFRSDLCMRYCPAITVDAALAAKYTDADGKLDSHAAAAVITRQLQNQLDEVTINAPTWSVLRLAITAARLHQPIGTDLSLGQYLTLVRGWVQVIKLGVAVPEGGISAAESPAADLEAASSLRTALCNYQDLLDKKGIKCERVRRAAGHGQALPWYWCVTGMAQRGLLFLVTMTMAAPGLLVFLPVWAYVKRRERFLLSKGPRWNDSVAEMKMMVCGLLGMGYVIASIVLSAVWWSWKPIASLYYMYVTMRCYEEAVSSARSFYTLYKLLFLLPQTMGRMVELRKDAKAAMDPCLRMLPAGVADHASLSADEARPTRALDYYFPWIVARIIMLFLRRRKKDWNEVLRLKDHATMDYVS
uniref:Phospholipid/glycerol acyltransferase domain-containing protein n=1 Tax=Haptolina brevifila TaxID=156173 RepID=A0A7S2ITC4_9EUKA|mmetsp:Transcript_70825/g.140375  ORF Transcript_70825/g.140375 Transcript_70825/m.140375 type:complete len:549 (+) Transcript_70825:86-1732(+)